MVLIPNNATLTIEAKDNGTLIATAGEKGKVYVLIYVDRMYTCVNDLEHRMTSMRILSR